MQHSRIQHYVATIMATSNIATVTATGSNLDLQDLPQRDVAAQDTAPVNPDDSIEASRLVDAGAPDGGQGWVVLAASSVIAFWFVGTTYCWGVIQGKLVQDELASASTLSWVGSLAVACNAIFSVPSSKVLRSLGSKVTAFIAVSFLATGEILSGFTTQHVGGLFACWGVITGIGVSLSFICVSSVTSQYFNKRRGLAKGIVFAAGGLGGAVISFMMEGLLESLGTAWTFRLVGIFTLVTGLPAAWFIKDRIPPSRRAFLEWRLFKDFQFVLLFLAGAIAMFPLLVPPFFLPLYGTSIGLSSATGAALVAGFNFSSAIGRIMSGFLSDTIGSLNTLTASLFLNSVSTLALWTISTSLSPLIAFSIVNGLAAGGFFALIPTVAGQIFGSSRVSIAISMLVTGWTAGYLMVSIEPPLFCARTDPRVARVHR